ncbi:MAG: helix-turn-helix transcriptional regulator [Nitrososphaerota archaeon]|jgi:DNA-binding transcriptional ArsR family regulator|nr:helix-turn-helix transcriptional regulator [Nitrososphaerota archaeon]
MPGIRKGRVREAIISVLSHQPKSMTELSSELGIAKSTASYHLCRLLEDGQVTVASLTPVRGKAVIKKYTILRKFDNGVEAETLRTLLGRVESERLNWSGGPDDLHPFLVNLLFHSFRYLCDLNGMEHERILRRVGEMVGRDEISRLIVGTSLKQVLDSLFDLLSSSSISTGLAIYTRSGANLTFSDFLDCQHFDSRIASFFEGLLSGILESKFNLRYGVLTARSADSLGLYNYILLRGKRGRRG